MRAAFCKRCGAKIDDGDTFCTSCGWQIPATAPTQTAANAPPLTVIITISVAIVALAAVGTALYSGVIELPFGDSKASGKRASATRPAAHVAPTMTAAPASTTISTPTVAVDPARQRSYDRLAKAYGSMPSYDDRIARLASAFNADITDGKASESTCNSASSLLGEIDGDVEGLAAGNSHIYPDHADDQKHVFDLYEYLGTRAGALADACYASRDGRPYGSFLQSGRSARIKYDRYYPLWRPKL